MMAHPVMQTLSKEPAMTASTDKWAEGRVAFVTGATSGFGHAFALRILGAGGRGDRHRATRGSVEGVGGRRAGGTLYRPRHGRA